MKKIIATFCVLMLIVASKASAQKEQTRQVSGFSGIANNGSFDVKVKIDGTESVRVVSDKDEYDKIETVVEGGILRIGTKRGMGWNNGVHGNVTVYVTAKSLSDLRNNGSGDLTIEGDLHGSNVMATNTGSGALKITGSLVGEKASLDETGSGDVVVNGSVSGGDVNVRVTGSGNITTGIKANNLSTRLTGSGNINLNGTAGKTDVTVSSSGQINGRNLKANEVNARITGSGNIHIGVEKTISAHISGSGSITYNGSGSLAEFHSSGSGGIRHGNED